MNPLTEDPLVVKGNVASCSLNKHLSFITSDSRKYSLWMADGFQTLTCMYSLKPHVAKMPVYIKHVL